MAPRYLLMPKIQCACGCGTEIEMFYARGHNLKRTRRYIWGHHRRGIPRPAEWKQKRSVEMTGPKNHRWISDRAVVGRRERNYMDFSHSQRKRLLKDSCGYCGSIERLELDHIVPIFAGGMNYDSNAQTLCRKCNQKKRDLDYRYYGKLGELRGRPYLEKWANPEPSKNGNILEGATTRGRACGLAALLALAVISPTSAQPERDDIVCSTKQFVEVGIKSPTITKRQFKWGRIASSITISGQEQDQNSGEAQVADLLKDKVTQAMMSIADKLGNQLFASSINSKAILNLPSFVDASSTIGDINSNTNTWWQATTKASGSFAAQGRSDWTNVYNTITIQGTKAAPPDFGVTTQAVFEAYEATLAPAVRFAPNGVGDIGFDQDMLKFKGMRLAFDPNCDSQACYFLSSDAMKLVVHSARNFSRTPMVKPANQDALTGQIIWMGQMTTNNRRKLARLSAMTA